MRGRRAGAEKVASGLRHQREKALHHSAVWISERIEHGEVIGIGDLLVPGRNASLAPRICNKPALPQEFIRLARTDHSVEYEAAWRRDGVRLRPVSGRFPCNLDRDRLPVAAT